MGRLTVAKVRSVCNPGRYGDGDTLYLHIAPGGSKSWVQRLTVNGRTRDIGLGGWPVVSLATAREKAFENRRVARAGGDPLARRQRTGIPLFREAAERTFTERKSTWRNKNHTRNWLRSLEIYAYPVLGDLRVDQIENEHVLRVLLPIWSKKMETARRVRHRVRAVLSWCQAHKFVSVNVAGEAIDGALPKMPVVQEHHMALPYSEIREVLRIVESGAGSPSAKLCFRFTVLTACRSNEALGARWDEIRWEERLWCIPAARTKINEEHRQPLSEAALEVLRQARELEDGTGWVFPSTQRPGKSLSAAAMMVVLKRNGLRERMTVHGCRATFRTWADEQTDAAEAVKELSLGHRIGNAVVRAYARGDLLEKRAALMEAWGRTVTGTG